MNQYLQGRSLERLFGIHVVKPAFTLPASGSGALYTITGGRIMLVQIFGEVTTIIQAQACNTKLISTPTTGTAVDMCAVLDITGDEVGCLYGITGIPADALIGTNAGLTPAMQKRLILPIGTINLNTGATNTGATKWDAWYIPLDAGAAMVAA